jgi:hypothetical protein
LIDISSSKRHDEKEVFTDDRKGEYTDVRMGELNSLQLRVLVYRIDLSCIYFLVGELHVYTLVSMVGR